MLFIYLYFGYSLVKLYSVINVLSQQSIALSSVIYSLVIFVIWSFIPILGYLFAKLIGAKGHSSEKMLFIVGAMVGLLESTLLYFEAFSGSRGSISTLIVMGVFFITAYFSLKEPSFLQKNSSK